MCPDIETFAPLIHATFGAGQEVDDGDEEIAMVLALGQDRGVPTL